MTKAKTKKPDIIEALAATIFRGMSKDLRPNNRACADRAIGLIKALADLQGASLQDPSFLPTQGMLIRQPFNFVDAQELKIFNEHHATCVRVKRQATVGLGLRDRAFARQLNKLCRLGTARTFKKLMGLIEADYVETGNGFMEVVRQGPGGPILGLHHVPSPQLQIVVENKSGLLAYEMNPNIVLNRQGSREALKSTVRIMADYGRAAELQELLGDKFEQTLDGRIAEIIHFKASSNMSRYYGVPDWLSVVSSCELVSAVRQHVFDYFNNRGVPNLLLLLKGGYIGKELWEDLANKLQDNVGPGNAYRTNAFHLPDKETDVFAQKLSPDNTDNGTFYRDMMEALSTVIVSAHGVPPQLAGIQIPGRLGSVNDLPNAIIAFQAIYAGPEQTDREEQLWETLGNPEENGGLQVPTAAEDSNGPFEFRSVVEEMAEAMKELAPAQTMGQARQNLAQQATEGRNLQDGVKA